MKTEKEIVDFAFNTLALLIHSEKTEHLTCKDVKAVMEVVFDSSTNYAVSERMFGRNDPT